MPGLFDSYALGAAWIIFGVFLLVFLVMAPCHAIFLLPLAGIPLFWLLPPGQALPVNIGIWAATPFLYRVIRKAMKKPLADGFYSLVGTRARVVTKSENVRPARYLVRAGGELWSAHSAQALESGEWVNIVGVEGVGLVVERANCPRPEQSSCGNEAYK